MKPKSKRIVRTPRQKTKLRIRKKISGSELKPRISVFKSTKYTYAQVISDETGKTMVSASTREGEVLGKVASVNREGLCNDSNSAKSAAAAKALGTVLAARLKAAGISAAVFDRNGYQYHGRIKAVAEGMREAGLKL